MLEFINFVFPISTVLLAINAILFSVLAFKRNQTGLFILSTYLLTVFFIQLYSAWLAFNGIHNLFLTHFYFIFQLVLLGYFYYIITDVPLQQKIIKYSIPICLLVLGIQYTLRPELFTMFNNLEIFLTSFLLIVFSLFHFYNLLDSKRIYLYLNIGVFFYFFAGTALFLLGNLSTVIDIAFINWDINLYIYTIFQVLILVEWFQVYFKKTHIKTNE